MNNTQNYIQKLDALKKHPAINQYFINQIDDIKKSLSNNLSVHIKQAYLSSKYTYLKNRLDTIEAQKNAPKYIIKNEYDDVYTPDVKPKMVYIDVTDKPNYENIKISVEEVKEAPQVEVPAQEVPAQEVPAQEAQAQEAPAQEAPAQEAPAQEAPQVEAQVQEAPAQEAPAQEAPAQEAPAQEVPQVEATKENTLQKKERIFSEITKDINELEDVYKNNIDGYGNRFNEINSKIFTLDLARGEKNELKNILVKKDREIKTKKITGGGLSLNKNIILIIILAVVIIILILILINIICYSYKDINRDKYNVRIYKI